MDGEALDADRDTLGSSSSTPAFPCGAHLSMNSSNLVPRGSASQSA
ncbi:unnamed protein product [Protopolystoma xenopodis]|uniref:Uncharacterized protein n=1 Tax=Protopolystoma xenopodis TaxID=117903 RepID=A0A448XHH0_9PLAT|nr:unnamed protein product [Protopolystoma xenopodis]